MGIIVTTPGSLDFKSLNIPIGPTPPEIESAITFILSGLLDLASSVIVQSDQPRIVIQVHGPRLRFEDTWYFRCLGSPVASIAATVCCEAMGKPVRIVEESPLKTATRLLSRYYREDIQYLSDITGNRRLHYQYHTGIRGANRPLVYFIVNVIAFLIITLMHTYLNRSSRRLLGGISAVLFAGFAIVAALKIIEAL